MLTDLVNPSTAVIVGQFGERPAATMHKGAAVNSSAS